MSVKTITAKPHGRAIVELIGSLTERPKSLPYLRIEWIAEPIDRCVWIDGNALRSLAKNILKAMGKPSTRGRKAKP